MELVDLALGDGDDADVGEGELLVKGGDILIAGEAAEGFGHDHVESAVARVCEELLVAGTQVVGAALRAITGREPSLFLQ